MTYIEAQQIAEVVATAHGHCKHCVKELCEKLNDAFPAFTWTGIDLDKYPYYGVSVEVRYE